MVFGNGFCERSNLQAVRTIREYTDSNITKLNYQKAIGMKINSKDFLVQEGKKVKLKDWPTIIKPVYKSKEQYQQMLREHMDDMNSLQNLLYASNRYSLLLIFQSMDAAGKDSAIKHVMSGINP
jgi:polyphosphate kinase 2 (PPK2 family)